MSEYNPDHWVMLEFTHSGQKTYKILAGWGGSYLYGASWKLNSGCTKIEKDGDYYLFHGYSGSVYRCHKNSYGLSGYTAQILRNFEEQVKTGEGVAMQMLPEETNFMEIEYV